LPYTGANFFKTKLLYSVNNIFSLFVDSINEELENICLSWSHIHDRVYTCT